MLEFLLLRFLDFLEMYIYCFFELRVSLQINSAMSFTYKNLMLPYQNFVKSEEEIEYLYARKMAQQGPFQITRNSNCPMPTYTKSGHWSEKQNAKYYAFLKKFKLKFEEKQARRQWKVFKTLADFIKTRNPNQCRSHHHKMQKNFETVEETLEFLRQKIPSVQKRCKKYDEQLENAQITVVGLGTQNDAYNPVREENHKPNNPNVNKHPMNFWCDSEEKGDKKQDQANAKTKDDYEQGEKNHYNSQTSKHNIFGNFPSTGLLHNFHNIPQKMGLNSFCFNPSQSLQLEGLEKVRFEQKSQQQKWLECHHYFLKWVTKLKSLIGNSESNHFICS